MNFDFQATTGANLCYKFSVHESILLGETSTHNSRCSDQGTMNWEFILVNQRLRIRAHDLNVLDMSCGHGEVRLLPIESGSEFLRDILPSCQIVDRFSFTAFPVSSNNAKTASLHAILQRSPQKWQVGQVLDGPGDQIKRFILPNHLRLFEKCSNFRSQCGFRSHQTLSSQMFDPQN
jgi:hypothetical protein